MFLCGWKLTCVMVRWDQLQLTDESERQYGQETEGLWEADGN